MSILRKLPFSLCEAGPEHVDGIGNFYRQVLASAPSQRPLLTIFFLDSHGQIPSLIYKSDYDHIKQSQIDWFLDASQALRSARDKDNNDNGFHPSLVFQHIPLPEFGEHRLIIRNGHRGEPTEGPRYNSHFFDALTKEGVSAIGCGHDHVNDFCALLPQHMPQGGDKPPYCGPWLCYGGGSGSGGYCSFGGKQFHRRMRVWELNTNTGSLETWKRVEYALDRIDKVVLVGNEVVTNPS
jgi:3',5'-cyclic AMP phosphodiesterase CpdA